jgi:hypothetical protein
MDKQKCKTVSIAIMAALAAIELEHEVKFSRGNASYGAHEFGLKITATDTGEGGEVFDMAADEFTQYAKLLGLQPEDLGRVFQSGGRGFVITGLKMKNRKLPVIATCGGKSYKFRSEDVRRALAV